MEHVVSNSPHVKCGNSTRKIMLDVVIALLPAAVAGIVYFGWRAALVIALSVVSAVLSEGIFLLCMKKSVGEIVRSFDCSSVVTGLLLALTLSASVPWYVPVLSAAFAVVVVKMLFGGTGKNLVNPALAGRIFAFISFQMVMTSGWLTPLSPNVEAGATILPSLIHPTEDAALSVWDFQWWELFLGINVAGCIGETCKLAIILGGIYLVCRGVLDFRWPLVYLLTAGLFTVALNGFDFAYFFPSLFTGGIMLGAIFMATDYVTTPNTKAGNYVYFILLGLLTAGLQVVSFAILLMNLTVPLIDKWIYPRPFGYRRIKKEAK